MNMKKIGTLMLMLAVVGVATTAVYANKKSDVVTKNAVVAVQKKTVKKSLAVNNVNKVITDEQAVKMATKAMKDYMGLDANYFSKTSVEREKGADSGKISDKQKQEIINSEKCFLKVHPELASKAQETINKVINDESHKHEIINVDFTRSSGDGTDFVSIDAVTTKIVNITAINDLPTFFQGKVDDAKVKDAAINFIKKIGMDSEVDFNKLTIDNDKGSLCKLTIPLKNQSSGDNASIGLEVGANNYSVMHYDDLDGIYSK